MLMRKILETEIKIRQYRKKYPDVYNLIVSYRHEIIEDIRFYLAREVYDKGVFDDCNEKEKHHIDREIFAYDLVGLVYQQIQTKSQSTFHAKIGKTAKESLTFFLNCALDCSVKFGEELAKLNEGYLYSPENYEDILLSISFNDLCQSNNLYELFHVYFMIQLKFDYYSDINTSEKYLESLGDLKKLKKFDFKYHFSTASCFVEEKYPYLEKENLDDTKKTYTSLNVHNFENPDFIPQIIIEFLESYSLNHITNYELLFSQLDHLQEIDFMKVKKRENDIITDVIQLMGAYSYQKARSYLSKQHNLLSVLASLMCWDLALLPHTANESKTFYIQILDKIKDYFFYKQGKDITLQDKRSKDQSPNKHVKELVYIPSKSEIELYNYSLISTETQFSISSDVVRKQFKKLQKHINETTSEI